MTFHHGISVTETLRENRSLAINADRVIGLVVTGPAADAAAFPLHQCVKIAATGIVSAIAKAGATGTIRDALSAIATHVRTPIVLVRVAPGVASEGVTAQAATDANVIAGITLLRGAQAAVGLTPELIGAPGLDSEDVADELASVAANLRAFAYAHCHGTDDADKIAYRENFTDRELMLISGDFKIGDTTSPAVAHALGLRARIDKETGFHKSLSNVPVPGVTGVTEAVTFDFQSVDTQANALNAAGITVLVNLNGEYRFWGNRTCADPDSDSGRDFVFETATRTAQILAQTIATGHVWALGKPMAPSLVTDLIEQINDAFRQFSRPGINQRVLGAAAWYDADRNPIDNLKGGKLLIRFKYTPIPTLENLNIQQEITDDYLLDFNSLNGFGG